MTSNLGSHLIHEMAEENNYEKMRDAVMDVVGDHFRPEFINRIDERVVFHPLGLEEMRLILRILLKKLRKRLAERELGLELTDAAAEFIANEGYNPAFGARPLKRAIQQLMENLYRKHCYAVIL